MKHFKFLIVFCTMFLLCGCSLNGTDSGNEANAENAIIYASELVFETDRAEYYVGESIKISDINLKVRPSNATVKPKISISDYSLINFENDIITFNKEGKIEVTASILSDVNTYKTTTKTFSVVKKPVFAKSLSFEHSNITLNFNETAENKVLINPITYNQGVEVEYLHGGIVNYDYSTGIISPIKSGSDTIYVKLKLNKNEILSASFDVIVTNNIFAEEIIDININNKIVAEEITLFTGDKGKFTCFFTPQNYNMGIKYSVSSELMKINEDGSFAVGNKTGTCDVVVTAKSNKESFIERTFKVNIVNANINLEFEIFHNEAKSICAYTDITYNAYVLTPLEDYSEVKFENCEFEYISNNMFELKFLQTGNINIKINYEVNGFLTNCHVQNNKKIIVYNQIKDVNFSLNCKDEIIPENNNYTIYLPDLNNYELAVQNNEKVYADIVLSAKCLNTNPSALTYFIEGESIEINENRIIPLQIGASKLIIKSNDVYGFTKEINIVVKPLVVNTINIPMKDVTLYLNGDDSQPNSFKIEYNLIPDYSYNKDVVISSNSDIVNIIDNVVYANSEGCAVISVVCGEIAETINVVVEYVANNICAYINAIEIFENTIVSLETNADYYLSYAIMSNFHIMSGNAEIYINDVKQEDNTSIRLNFEFAGDYLIEIKFKNLIKTYNINVKLINPITSFSFETDNADVNIFNCSTQQLNYNITKKFENEETSDSLTFKSSDENIIIIENNILKFLNEGTAEIFALINDNIVDSLIINVYYKEYYEINSINEFKGIEENKNYVVNSNLDFSDFGIADAINFNGEMDFNNKTLSNIKFSIFNSLGKSAVVKNAVISGSFHVNNLDKYCVITAENEGLIYNINFINATFEIVSMPSSEPSRIDLSLIAYNNFGVVDKINYSNVLISTEIKRSGFSDIVMSSVVNTNMGTISNILGEVLFVGFTRCAGVAINNYNEIININLNISFYCTQEKQQIGGLIYSSKSNNTEPEMSNIKANISLFSNSKIIKFGGFIFNCTNLTVENVILDFKFFGDINSNDTYLICLINSSNLNMENNKEFEVSSNIEVNISK